MFPRIDSPLEKKTMFYPVRPSMVRWSPGDGGRGHRRALVKSCAACLAVLWQASAFSQSAFQPYASAYYEHDSNLFDSAAGVQLPAGITGSDTTLEYVAGLHGDAKWSLDDFTYDIEGRRFNYDRNSYLDHNSYLLSGRLAWVLANVVDGSLGVRQEQLLQPFDQRLTTTLALQTDRAADVLVRIGLQPSWHLELGVKYHQIDAPQIDLPDYGLHETTSTAALKFRVVEKLELGLDAQYLAGDIYGAPGTLPYRQGTGQFTANYVATGISTFTASAGYTDRTAVGAEAGNYSGPIGALGYTRKLTGKTSVNLQLTRTVNSYVYQGNAEIDTSAIAAVDWKATHKIDVGLNVTETHSVYIGQPIVPGYPAGLTAQYLKTNLEVRYKPERWLLFRLYGQYQRRNSNEPLFAFSGNTVGLEFRLGFSPDVIL